MTKLPYTVPTMGDVAAIDAGRFTVVSTFSGCGGSSLGYRMAGGRVLWANEFVDEARRTYIANCSPSTIVDGRDVRQVSADDILDAIVMRPGDLDVFDSSPPCSSFSMAGKRERGWGQAHSYSDGQVQQTDNLFDEAIRLLRGLMPKTFVFENVSGLVKGTAKGTFLTILRDLKASGYRVEARVVDASWLGTPQSRQRTIFVGVRDDLGIDPVFPQPFAFRYSVRDALDYVAGMTPTPSVEADTDISRFAIGREWDRMRRPGTQSEKYFQLVRPDLDKPCPTITATAGQTGAAGVAHPTERRKFSIAEVKALSGVPHDFALTGSFRQQWERLGRIHCPLAVKAIAERLHADVLTRITK